MRALRRLAIALVALGVTAWSSAAPAVAVPSPTPTSPPCKAGSLKMAASSNIGVAGAPDSWVSRSAAIQNTTGYYYSDLTLAFDIWPDTGTPGTRPMMHYIGTNGTVVSVTLRPVSKPRAAWRAERLKPPKVWPNGTPSFLGIELSFPANSAVTTYSTKLTLTAGVCGDTVLASTSGMRFGFMTGGAASASPKPSASAKASAKASRKPSPAPGSTADTGGEVQPPTDDVAPGDSSTAEADAAMADQAMASSSSPLPWLAGLGVTALVCAGGLIWWVRRNRDEDDEDDDYRGIRRAPGR